MKLSKHLEIQGMLSARTRAVDAAKRLHARGEVYTAEEFHRFTALCAEARWLTLQLFHAGHTKDFIPPDVPRCMALVDHVQRLYDMELGLDR
jgi:hypothetical protein